MSKMTYEEMRAEIVPPGWFIAPPEAVRCMVTGKLYGTDTRPVDRPCQCAVCKAMAFAEVAFVIAGDR